MQRKSIVYAENDNNNRTSKNIFGFREDKREKKKKIVLKNIKRKIDLFSLKEQKLKGKK